MLTISLPIRTVSETNQREHWAKRHRRRKAQREAVLLSLAAAGHGLDRGDRLGTYTVTITRTAPRHFDGDNLQSSNKAIRDAIAEWLGIDDGSDRIVWHYHQRKGRPKEYLVDIAIERDDEMA